MAAAGEHKEYPYEEEWRPFALCRGRRDVQWHPPVNPVTGDSRMPDWTHDGRDICAKCPVQPECLAHALANYEHGLWGGFTELERRYIKKIRSGDMKVPPCPICGDPGVFTNNNRDRAMCMTNHRHRYGRDRLTHQWHA